MAEKKIRICDRCGFEVRLPTDTKWSQLTAHDWNAHPLISGMITGDKIHICDKCTEEFLDFWASAPRKDPPNAD